MLMLLSEEGHCWVFPAVSCRRSWTQLLHHTESILGIESCVRLWMAVEVSWGPELLLSLYAHATQPGLRTQGAHHHHEHSAVVSSISHGRKDEIVFSMGSSESSTGSLVA